MRRSTLDWFKGGSLAGSSKIGTPSTSPAPSMVLKPILVKPGRWKHRTTSYSTKSVKNSFFTSPRPLKNFDGSLVLPAVILFGDTEQTAMNTGVFNLSETGGEA